MGNVSSKAADEQHLVSDQVGNVSSKAADEPHLVSDQVRNVSSISPNTIKFQHPPAIIPYLIPITSSPQNPARRRGGVHGASAGPVTDRQGLLMRGCGL